MKEMNSANSFLRNDHMIVSTVSSVGYPNNPLQKYRTVKQ